MNQERTSKLNPVTFGFLLMFIMNLTIAGFIAANIFFQSKLKELELDVRKANNAVTTSKSDLSGLKELRNYLKKEKDTIEKTKKILADSQSYQDQVLGDIEKYASRSGITVTGVTFDSNDASSTTNGTQPTQPSTNGLRYATATINIKNPVQYSNIMQFLYSLEQNLTKLQINGVTITKTSKSGQEVTINPLTIKVYLR